MILRARLPNDLLRSYCPTVPLLYASRLWESNLLAAPAPAVEAVSDGTHKNRLAWRAAALIGIWLQYQVAKSWCGIHYLSSNFHVQCREKLKFIFLACSRRVLQIFTCRPVRSSAIDWYDASLLDCTCDDHATDMTHPIDRKQATYLTYIRYPDILGNIRRTIGPTLCNLASEKWVGISAMKRDLERCTFTTPIHRRYTPSCTEMGAQHLWCDQTGPQASRSGFNVDRTYFLHMKYDKSLLV